MQTLWSIDLEIWKCFFLNYNYHISTPRLSGWTRECNRLYIDFKGEPFFESAAWFLLIILKFIFTSIFVIKIHEKNSLTLKKFHFLRPIFNNHHIYKQVFLKASKVSVWYYPRFCRSQRRGPFILTNSVTLTSATRAAGPPYFMLAMLDILTSSKEFWSISDLILWVIIYDRSYKHFWTPVIINKISSFWR